VAAGKVSWSEGPGAPPVQLPTPGRQWLLGNAPLSDAPFPSWIAAIDERSPMQVRASGELAKSLPMERPVTLGLKELAGDRKIENSLLASQCLAYVGEFDALVTMLHDVNQKNVWQEQVEALREAIGHSPMTAAAVRQAFERHYGGKAPDLYRMLWGYTPDQISAGSGAQLIKNLDHEDVEFRVLAIYALVRISGGDTLLYRPEYPAARRSQFVAKWKSRLDSGRLFPK
jgi:hypothetical protein